LLQGQKSSMLTYLDGSDWTTRTAYLADNVDQLNEHNLKLQGKDYLLKLRDCLQVLICKWYANCRTGTESRVHA